MTVYNHLVIWGNATILIVTIGIGYYFFMQTDDYQRTDIEIISFENQPLHTVTDSTVMFLMVNLLWTHSALAMYWGNPWKIRFYNHYPLLILFLLDMIAGTIFFFFTHALAGPF